MNFWKSLEKQIIIHKNKMNIAETCSSQHVKSQPQKPAFVFEDEKGKIIKITYCELEKLTNKFANVLKKLEIKKGSRIFLFLPKIPELYISFLGAIKAGCIACPIFEAFSGEGLNLRLKKSEANIIITNKELSKRLTKKIPALKKILLIDSKEFKQLMQSSPEFYKTKLMQKKDTAVMIFTSSTAGTPIAGIMIPHYGLIQQKYSASLILGLKKDDKYWCTADPAWVTGSIYGIIAPLSIGCTIYVLSRRFDSQKWQDFIYKNKINVLYTAPTALRMIQAGKLSKNKISSLRNVCSVGEALTKTSFNFFKKIGIEINDTYWQTETGSIVIANHKKLKKKPGSMGKPLPGIKAFIVNDALKNLPINKVGKIVLKKGWPSMMAGIYKNEKMYKSYFRNGFFITNDLAYKDKDGYFFFVSRADDIIKTSGERVSPIEIENILQKHPYIEESGVIGIPDKIRGQIIKAFIVLKNNIKPSESLKEEIKLFVKKSLAGHAYPREIEFIKSLPKTESGKIIRMKLRK